MKNINQDPGRVKNNQTILKAFLTLAGLAVFPILVISGLVLDRSLSFSRFPWKKIHYSFGLLFTLLILFYLTINWNYLKTLPKVVQAFLKDILDRKK